MNCQCTCACQRRETPVSTTSPLAIDMLIHFRCKGGPFIKRPFEEWPPAQRAIVQVWVAKGLIQLSKYYCGNPIYRTTELGELTLKRLLDAAKQLGREGVM